MNRDESTRRCGDWLLVFGDVNPAGLSRRHDGAPWETAYETDGAVLLTQAPGTGWRGAPWKSDEGEAWRSWLLGETYPLDDERWRRVPTGAASPVTLNGHFLLLARHRPSGEWHLWTDRFGTLHAYRAPGDRAPDRGAPGAVGTWMPAVAAAGGSARRLDWVGLTGFFGCGFFPGDRTHWDDVRILRPARHCVFDRAGALLRDDRYWQWRHAPDEGRSYAETVDEFARRLRQVMTDHVSRGRVAVPVSGGLDSRSTVAALDPTARSDRLTAYSYGFTARSGEVRIARRIAHARDLPLRELVIEPYLFDRLPWVLDAVEGFQDLTLCRQAGVADELETLGDSVIAAHWGDVWLDSMGLADARGPRDLAGVVDHALGRIRKPADRLLDLCRPHLGGAEPAAVLRETVRRGLEPLAHLDDPDFRVKAFKTDGWSHRWTTASLRMFQPAAFPRLTFYDTRLTDFFATVPSRFVVGRRLQIDYLKRHAPDLARIPWDRYDANLYLAPYFGTLLLPLRAVRKLRRVVTGARVVERNWEIQYAGETGRRGLERWLLRPGLRLHEFVAPGEVRTLVEDFYARWPDGALGYEVSMLLTFSAWLEHHG